MAVTDFQKIKVYLVLLKVWMGYETLGELLIFHKIYDILFS